MEDKIKIGYDIVVIARGSANGAAYTEIDKSVKHLMKKHDMYVEKEG